MNQRFTLFRRAGIFYAQDSATGKQNSLRQKTKARHSRCQRIWVAPDFVETICSITFCQVRADKIGSRTQISSRDLKIQHRLAICFVFCVKQSAKEDKAFDAIRHRKLVETKAEHFFSVLKTGTVSTNVFLRRAHNFALALNWLPWPVCQKMFGRKFNTKKNAPSLLKSIKKLLIANAIGQCAHFLNALASGSKL